MTTHEAFDNLAAKWRAFIIAIWQEFYMSQKKEFTKHINQIGFPVKDKVTGYEGVITSVAFDLYGCVQAAVTPLADKDGKINSGHWFDVTRLVKTSGERAMPLPDFAQGYVAEGKKGASEKPNL